MAGKLSLWGCRPCFQTTRGKTMRRFSKTWVRSLALAGVGLLMVSMASQRGVSAQTADPVAVVDAYRVAIGHDVEAALALVADDATFTTVPPPPGTPGRWTGKEQIRQ